MKDKTYKIMILENVEGQYRRIRDRLVSALGSNAIVLPNKMDKSLSVDNFTHLVHLITQGNEEDFNQIVEDHPDIDIFIIDNVFKRGEHNGTKFRNFVRQINYNSGNYNLLIVTGTPKNELPLDIEWDREREVFIEKNYSYVARILEIILGIMDIGTAKTTPTLSTNLQDYITPGEKKHMDQEDFEHKVENRLDVVILWGFYISIPIFAMVTFYDLLKDFVLGDNSFTIIADNDILKRTEHIYTNILPLFVLFGFFNYYKGYIRVAFLSDRIGEIHDANATKAMRLTKILFVSSIISFTCIVIIEELFSKNHDLTKLIGCGSLLIILVVYFIFLEKLNHKKE